MKLTITTEDRNLAETIKNFIVEKFSKNVEITKNRVKFYGSFYEEYELTVKGNGYNEIENINFETRMAFSQEYFGDDFSSQICD